MRQRVDEPVESIRNGWRSHVRAFDLNEVDVSMDPAEDGSRLSAAARAQMIDNLRVSLAKINSLASKPMVKATFKELQVACGVAAAQAEALSVVG